MTTNINYRAGAIHLFAFILLMMPAAATHLLAQQYSYLPSASTTDDRFLSIAGGGIQTLGESHMTFKLASPAYAISMEIGVFDGDTRGVFDQGNVPLIFTLYADPEGDGTGTMRLAEWSGDSMPDNDWFTANIVNTPAARCICGNYFYLLDVRSSNPQAFQWSSFKLRTDGTISAAHATNFTFSAPLGNALDAAVVYPLYPTLTPTTYDGTWHFQMNVPYPVSSLEIWDGDFDRGSYNCSDNDTDDEDTPNVVPSWATGEAVAEGTASSSVSCQDADGHPIDGNTTGNPPDDSRNPVFSRSGSVSYNVTAPDGMHYANDNPSGNLEWEQFRISTDAFNRSTMDYHASALPAGIYDIAITGMDLSNLNAFRFPYDVAGVDASGNPVMPIRPDYNDGSISGTIYLLSDNGSSGTADPGSLDPSVPQTWVHLQADYDRDGITDEEWSMPVDIQGGYDFTGLHPGAYTISVDVTTLPPGTIAMDDSDGSTTPNSVKVSLTMCSHSALGLFIYRVFGDGGMLSDASN
ncbi:MAG: hypothetical protein JST22_01740 [Bacteroidetes bacterium]|nr:hypothetical protein [Bacteroidota bacterium]